MFPTRVPHVAPSVGLIVDYFPGEFDVLMAGPPSQPLVGLIVHVWSEWCVNLVVFDVQGALFVRTSVQRYPDITPQPLGAPRWHWPARDWPPAEVAPAP